MKKIDIILAIVAGLGVAYLFSGLLKGFKNLDIDLKFWQIILTIALPLLSVSAIWLAQIIGRKFLFVLQAAKFLLIGVLATLFHLGILNLLMWGSGKSQGWFYSIFVAIAFVISTAAKYWGNKFWAFEKSEMSGVKKEMTQFYIVTLIGLGMNVGIASLIVNTIGPQFGASSVVWANIGGICAAIAVAAWNFLGYKFIVFRS